MSNFDGYSEPTEQTNARAWRIALSSKGYAQNLTTEAEAEAIHGLIYDAEVMELPADVQDIVKWQNEPDFEDEPKEVQPKVDFTKIKPIQF